MGVRGGGGGGLRVVCGVHVCVCMCGEVERLVAQCLIKLPEKILSSLAAGKLNPLSPC
jgi:hypothetical protein